MESISELFSSFIAKHIPCRYLYSKNVNAENTHPEIPQKNYKTFISLSVYIFHAPATINTISKVVHIAHLSRHQPQAHSLLSSYLNNKCWWLARTIPSTAVLPCLCPQPSHTSFAVLYICFSLIWYIPTKFYLWIRVQVLLHLLYQRIHINYLV